MGNYPDLYEGIDFYVDFNGDANDVRGGNVGTVTNATLTTDQLGNNRAYSFNGSTTLINYGVPAIPLGAKTISFWINTSTTGGTYILGNCPIVATSNGLNLFTTSSKIYFFMANGTATPTLNNPSVSNITGGRKHIVCTWDGTTGANGAKIYIDGVLDAQFTATTTTENAPANNLYFGRSPSGTAYYYTGSIGGTRILGRAWSAGEVKAEYDLTKQKYIPPFDKTLPLWWKENCALYLNGNYASTTAYDNSGNGNNGTINFTTTGRIGRHKYFDLDGTDDKITVATTNSVNAVGFWMNADANTKDIIKLTASDKISIDASNNITVTGFAGLNSVIYVNGTTDVGVGTSTWYYVFVTFDDLNCDAIDIGNNGSYNGKLAQIQMFTAKPTQTQLNEIRYRTFIHNP